MLSFVLGFKYRLQFILQLLFAGCAYIKANINPFSLGYNTYSEQEDGLYQCYLFCTRSFQYTYIGMHQRKCSCLVQTDIRDYNVCKTADIISCGFLNSTLCSTKENIVVLYKIKCTIINRLNIFG